ncbi:MAG: V4R domain-containing protein [Nanobdellota archaeon]
MKRTGAISKRVLLSKALRFKDGRINIWGIPGSLFSNYSLCYFIRALEVENNIQGLDTFYWMGFYQGHGAALVIKNKFGINKKVLENVVGQGEMLGYGRIFIKKHDFKRCDFIFEVDSSIAEQYRSVYGKSDKGVCYHFMGLFAGTVSCLLNKDVSCVEKKCMAKGDKFCIFRVKETHEFDEKDLPKKMPSPERLGDKKTTKMLR